MPAYNFKKYIFNIPDSFIQYQFNYSNTAFPETNYSFFKKNMI